ncbi:MAG: CRISPR-associated protein Cas4 [Clostridiales bacterium]|nr:CRISPR-associated protein Cas4 [Clostridiales bacterium]
MINIRSIQHYMYCPRRFGLLEINKDWAENVFVVKANLMHERVHSGSHDYRSAKKIEMSSVAVYNDELDLYGVTDCIEFEKSSAGNEIEGLEGKYKVHIIEYKPKQPMSGEIRETDAIQVFAQMLCADYVWNCKSDGYVYYADTRKRVKLPLREEFDRYYALLKELMQNMKNCMESGVIPPRVKGQNCSGCSVKDVCMPANKKYEVKKLVMSEEDI